MKAEFDSRSDRRDGRRNLVVIAASAGGVEALGDLLAALPQDYPLPIAVVQHRSPFTPGVLAGVLQHRTLLSVKDADDAEKIRSGHVYLAPADQHLMVKGGRLLLAKTSKVRNVRPAADVLFESAAGVYAEGLIAIVLTGGDADGSDGCRAVKDSGGTVIAQQPDEAEQPSMPLSAIATGMVDFILPLAAIALKLIALAAIPPA